jgi:hypothetical protein
MEEVSLIWFFRGLGYGRFPVFMFPPKGLDGIIPISYKLDSPRK